MSESHYRAPSTPCVIKVTQIAQIDQHELLLITKTKRQASVCDLKIEND